ncbi:MAG TPA: RES family NAD+ phosphorylase [Paracoccaceae bacterium]
MPESTSLSGTFYRIVFAEDLPRLLQGAKAPEGRFHHSGQPALYVSPTPQAAGFAIASYLRPDDPPRIIAPLRIDAPRIADLRDPGTLNALRLTGDETSIPWQPQRTLGLPASTWRASDVVRNSGADGMIYTARSAPDRWHLVLFRWNVAGAARVRAAGMPLPFSPA